MAANDTVQGQLSGILNSNSKLMKSAETFGKQKANQRGLLNSSMAVGASQNAMIQNAMPIAQQDAAQNFELGRMDKAQNFELDELQATSMANAWGVMSNNITDIVAQSMDAINNIQASKDISAADKAKMIRQVTSMRDTDIAFQQNLYNSLPTYLRQTNIFPSL